MITKTKDKARANIILTMTKSSTDRDCSQKLKLKFETQCASPIWNSPVSKFSMRYSLLRELLHRTWNTRHPLLSCYLTGHFTVEKPQNPSIDIFFCSSETSMQRFFSLGQVVIFRCSSFCSTGGREGNIIPLPACSNSLKVLYVQCNGLL